MYRDLEERRRISQHTMEGGPLVIFLSPCSPQSHVHSEARPPWGPEIRKLAQLPATTLLGLTYLSSSFRAGLTGPNASIIVALGCTVDTPSAQLQKVSSRDLPGAEMV